MEALVWLIAALGAGAAAYVVGWPAWHSGRARRERDLNADRYLAWRGRATRGQAPTRLAMTDGERRRVWIGAVFAVVSVVCLFAFFAAT